MTGGRQFYVYIMSNDTNTVTYTGVTSNLARRVHEHKEKVVEGFTKKYNIRKLVYYEVADDWHSALEREKEIKKGSRRSMVNLVNGMNADWRDLYEEVSGW